MSELIFGYKTDKGITKASNQDNLLLEKLNKRNGMFAVADGMGGHSLGEEASKMLVDILRERYLKSGTFMKVDKDIIDANSVIYETSLKEGVVMGSTLSVLSINEGCFEVFNVGDSRVYIIRGGEIEQITEDDSLVYEQYKSGVISKKEYLRSDKKNILLKSMGVESFVEPSKYEGRIEANDIFLITCDGLHNVFKEEELVDIVLSHIKSKKTLDEICVYLVEEAKRRNSTDNISIIIVWNMEENEKIKGFSKLKYILRKFAL